MATVVIKIGNGRTGERENRGMGKPGNRETGKQGDRGTRRHAQCACLRGFNVKTINFESKLSFTRRFRPSLGGIYTVCKNTVKPF